MSDLDLATSFDASVIHETQAAHDSREGVKHVAILLGLIATLVLLAVFWTPMIVLWTAVTFTPIYLLSVVMMCLGVTIRIPGR